MVINLPITLTGTTGFYSTTIVADLNNEVNEGGGEANNGSFLFNYRLDHGTASAGQITLTAASGSTWTAWAATIWCSTAATCRRRDCATRTFRAASAR